ncbi:MAG: glycoside hydrolase family 3 C-terminal domain-containing protein [Chloroflexi bacterium]|nr:glycoside hydrolase family 3 C-terminal domain-containing protein [Chloroflexota bacterium]
MTPPLPLYKDTLQQPETRAADLVSRMTLEEKVSQTLHDAPAIERLGVPAYNWWNECLHGVGRAGIATVFPQAIGLAAMWNDKLLAEIAAAISDEARAKHHDALRRGIHEIYYGLTFWTPNINIFRDPRWGRGQETYGEDPYLTARLGVTFVKGLQGDDPRYLKLVATPKHYAVHSGPEADRHRFNAETGPRDLWDTYLPAFEACVREGQAASIMGAYNRTNGEPCCASPTLLQTILRDRWGFAGFVVSDCGAIDDIYRDHKVVDTPEEAAALALKNGCDLNCGCTYEALVDAVKQGLLDEATLDRAVVRLFTARFRLGMFDAPEQVAYAQIPISVNDCDAHRALALRAARESIVLLKNADNMLPLPKTLKIIAVIGPNADDEKVLWGNYNGTPSFTVTPLAGIRAAVSPQTTVLYARGCSVLRNDTSGYPEALTAAARADVVIFVGGLSQAIEGEEGQEEGVTDGKSQGDRTDIALPRVQENLLKELHTLGKPVVLVLVGGSAVAINWADAHLPAILETWYGGQSAGTALADVLFGDCNPAGRLPITFYKSVNDLPPFEDYNMEGRTYRYFRGEPLYPFGYGLSYTTFSYSNLRLNQDSVTTADTITVSADVQNTGARAGDEVVQLYISDLEASAPVPIRKLQGFHRIHLKPGETTTVSFTLTPEALSFVDERGQRVIEPGAFQITIGGGQPGARAATGATLRVKVSGKKRILG